MCVGGGVGGGRKLGMRKEEGIIGKRERNGRKLLHPISDVFV